MENSTDTVTTTIHDETTPGGTPNTPTPGTEDTVYARLTQSTDTIAEDGGQVTYTVTLVDQNGTPVTVPAGETVTVGLAYTGTAAGTDYSGEQTSVTITAGNNNASFVVTGVDDAVSEGNETIILDIDSITDSGAFENVEEHADNQVTTTIVDDEATPSLSINDVTVDEAAGTATFTVTLDPVASGPVTVDYVTNNGTATAGADYTTTNGTLTFAAGVATQTISVPITDDVLDENSENFTVVLSNASGANISDDTGVGTILDEATPGTDDTVTVSLAGPANVVEGETTTDYTVTLSEPVPAGNNVTVNLTYTYTTASGSDITEVASVVVTGGNSTATFNIQTLDDAFNEGAEQFNVAIGTVTDTDSSFEAIAVDTANDDVTTTITDQTGSDNPPGSEDTVIVSLTGPANVVEGETTTDYTVTLSETVPAGSSVTVNLTYTYTTASGSDITEVASVVVTGGNNTATFNIVTLDDALDEGAENFNVAIGTITDTNNAFEAITAHNTANNVNTTITDQTGSDNPPGTEDTIYARLTQSTDTIAEDGGQVTYTVTLVDQNGTPVNVPAGETVTVGLAYTGTAAGTDYSGEQTSVTITGGNNNASFVVTGVDDAVSEGNETIILDIDSITDSGAFENVEEHADNQVTTTIVDDEATPSLSIDDVTVDEAAGTATFTVTLDPVASGPVTVDYVTNNGTATAGADYTTTNGTLTFAAGVATQTISVPITDDVLDENSENFTVVLSNASGANISDDTGVGTILDEATPGTDDTVTVSLAGPANVVEGETTTAYTVTLSEPVPAGNNVTVNLTYTYTTASGSDITEVASVVVTGGNSTATFNIQTLDDAFNEGAEQFNVAIGTVTDTDSSFEAIAVDTANDDVTTTITDQTGSDNPPGSEDTVIVSLTGPTNVVEGETTTDYTVTLSETVPAGSSVTVNLTYTYTTAEGDDITEVASVVVNGGSNTATFDIDTIDDALAEGAEDFNVAIGTITDTNNEFEAIAAHSTNNNVTTTITDQTGSDNPPGAEDTVIVSLVGPANVVEGETTTDYTVTLSESVPVGSNVTVNLSYTYTTASGTDITEVASVVVTGGNSSATFNIATLDDAFAEGAENFNVAIGSTSGGVFEAIIPHATNNNVTTTITDQTGSDNPPGSEDTVIASLTGPANVVEGETTTNYTVTLSETVPAGSSVTVNLTYTYTTAEGDDITEVASVVVNGGSNTATFTIDTHDDALAEGAENFNVAIGTIVDTNNEFEAIAAHATSNNVTTTITDQTGSDNPPGDEDTVFAVIESDGAVNEGSNSLFTVSLIDQNGAPVTVTADMEVNVVFANGTAENGDYTATAQTVTILNGNSSVQVTVPTAVDADFDDETFTASISGVGTGSSQFENVDTTNGRDGRTPSAEATITDTQGDVVVRINDPVGSLTEGETGTFTVGLFDVNGNPAPNATSDVTVNITYTGTATDGSDYTQVASVTIPAGSNSVDLDIVTLVDTVANEPDETVNIQLDSVTGGGFGNISIDSGADTADLTIEDGTPTVQITGSNQAFERGLAASGSGELADGNASNNSDTSEVTTGTIEFTDGSGGATVEISFGGTTITAAVGATITGDNGTLTITSITPPTSSTPGEVNYSYELTSRENHDGTNDNDTFQVVVSDNDGDAADNATTDLVIDIVDDGPSTNGQTRVMTIDVDTIVLNSYVAGFENEVIGTDNQPDPTWDFAEIQNDADALPDQIEWGQAASTSRSGYELVDDTGLASAAGEVVQTDQLVEFGTFTHHNWPTFSNTGTIESVDLTLTVNVVINGVSTPVTLTLTLDHNETPNANPQPINGGANTSDQDVITLPTTTQTVTVGGQDYEISIEGFLDSGGNAVNTIYTDESASNTFTVVGKVTSTDPLPVVTGRVDVESGADTGATVSWGAPSSTTLGTFTSGADGSYSFQVNRQTKDSLSAGDTETLTVPYTVTDSDGTTTSSSVTIVIAGKDAITGTSAGETLNGTSGNDSIVADAGADTLNGGAGNDTLYGEAGNDTLIGGAGEDILFGGTGADTFVLDTGITTGVQDVVKDFSITDDVLDLSSLLPDGASAATLDQYLHFEEDGSDIIIHVNTDGDYDANTRDDSKDEYTIRIENADAAFFNQTDQDVIQVLLNNNAIDTV
ncbi:Calx-beta domain-containing protein [Pseudoteredinibacter isoporae]|uniref:Calx-beta domain-containing protein n=1 Tax=Pseudoteredinibacter isoporae TaxID=570281 RepID=UPI003144E6E0